MKKYLSACIVSLICLSAFSQVQLGIKLSPSFSSNRVSTSSDTLSIEKNSVGIRYTVGITADFSFSQNYSFNTGLLFGTKSVAIKVTEPSGQLIEKYALQYLQIPATIKLLTNEFSLDTKVYFKIGGLIELNLNEKPKVDTNRYIQNFDALDVSLYLAAGVEKKLGVNTAGYLGFFYQRGLVNVVSTTLEFDDNLKIQNSLLGIDFGFIF